jgi:diguanylate cyclase (GGDEF)-like protein/PAS domain S-box-containing protein
MASGRVFRFRGRPSESDFDRRSDGSARRAQAVQSLEESGNGWFWSTDREGRLTFLSRQAADLFGIPMDQLLGQPFAQLFAASAEEVAARDRLPFVLNRQANFDRLTLQTRHEGGQRWWDVSGRISYSSGSFDGYFGFCIDVTDQLASSRSASEAALFDPLTGLPNRLNMTQFMADHIGGVRRCAVMLLDLDRFKGVNDTLGHPGGDALLKQVAGRLQKIIGDKQKIFRLGGDEFEVVLPGRDDEETLGTLAAEIISSLSQPYSINGIRCVIGASVGISISPRDGRTGDELTQKADLALYAAKSGGRGCFRFFSDDFLQVAEERRQLEEDLRDALVRDELSMAYQPLVCAISERVTGVEALIRWTHPKRGPISPEKFVPIAEEANLIDALGEWIIRKACADAASWPTDIRVAINVSPVQFANEALPSIVTSALANSGLPPHRLELELTEGIFLANSTETEAMFKRLKAIGLRLVLDDFGTGYSSLGYLRTVPFDKIKIDQSFVRGANEAGSRNAAIIAAIVALAGALNMETTAEGIETLDQLELVRSLGVSHIQGYVYSKPLDNDGLKESLSSGVWTIRPKGPAKHRSERRTIYRKAGAIIGSYYHSVTVRNISETGAYIEGLIDVPTGTQIILDFGEGRMEMAVVRRVSDRGYGVEFGSTLITSPEGSLTTRKVVSPYLLATHGLAGAAHAGKSKTLHFTGPPTTETIAAHLGLTIPSEAPSPQGSTAGASISDLSDSVRSLIAAVSPLQNLALTKPGYEGGRHLKPEEWDRLKTAVEHSPNAQLKYIVALVVLTGASFRELLAAKWSDVDLEQRSWTIPRSESGDGRTVRISDAALEILGDLPRSRSCDHLIINPRTNKPFHSVFGSWDAARKKAGLADVSIHDLRRSMKSSW